MHWMLSTACWKRYEKREDNMNRGQREIIADRISSTVRVLELLCFDYEVSAPRLKRKEGNKSPRIIRVYAGKKYLLTAYNDVKGNTWANQANGKPIPGLGSIENLCNYLRRRRHGSR